VIVLIDANGLQNTEFMMW